MLALHLKLLLLPWINAENVGFVQGTEARNIMSSWQTISITFYAHQHKTLLLLSFIDAKNVFNCVD